VASRFYFSGPLPVIFPFSGPLPVVWPVG
jgi:hypothetical protein